MIEVVIVQLGGGMPKRQSILWCRDGRLRNESCLQRFIHGEWHDGKRADESLFKLDPTGYTPYAFQFPMRRLFMFHHNTSSNVPVVR